MATTQDSSIGFAIESTYRTGVTPTRFVEFVDESFAWNKNIKQGTGLRVGGRVARSGRRVVVSADGSGDMTVEWASKGLGLLLQACFGNATSTMTTGSLYQQVFTLGDTLPSLTIQKGLVEAGGTVDAYTYLGCMVDTFEIDFPNADLVSIKPTFDIGDITTATAYAAPSYPAGPVNLFSFAGGSIVTGTSLTAPTTTELATFTTPTTIGDVRGGSLSVNNNLTKDRQNLGGAGRKSKPTVGLREITGSLTVEYDATTWRDAVLNDTPMALILNFTVGSSGEALQIALPELKFDSPLANVNGTDLITTDLSYSVLDNLTAAQPIWVVARTLDTAL